MPEFYDVLPREHIPMVQVAARMPSTDPEVNFNTPVELGFDATGAVAEAYGSWVEKENYGKKYWGTARTTFLIDPEGQIAKVWPKVKPEGHAAEVLTALDELQSAHVG